MRAAILELCILSQIQPLHGHCAHRVDMWVLLHEANERLGLCAVLPTLIRFLLIVLQCPTRVITRRKERETAAL